MLFFGGRQIRAGVEIMYLFLTSGTRRPLKSVVERNRMSGFRSHLLHFRGGQRRTSSWRGPRSRVSSDSSLSIPCPCFLPGAVGIDDAPYKGTEAGRDRPRDGGGPRRSCGPWPGDCSWRGCALSNRCASTSFPLRCPNGKASGVDGAGASWAAVLLPARSITARPMPPQVVVVTDAAADLPKTATPFALPRPSLPRKAPPSW